MFFIPCSVGRQLNPLVLALKKSVALQLRRQLLAGVTLILGGSSTSVTTSSASQMLPTVALVPSVGQADMGAQRAPSEVTEERAMVVILLPTIGQIGLLTMLVVLTMVGAM